MGKHYFTINGLKKGIIFIEHIFDYRSNEILAADIW